MEEIKGQFEFLARNTEKYKNFLVLIYKKGFKTPTNSLMEKLTNFVSCCENVFTHISTWIADKDLIKRHCQIRKNSKAIRHWKTSPMWTTNIQ